MAVNVSRFHELFRYQSRAPVPDLLEDMEVLSQLDARAEGQRRALEWSGWFTVIPGAVMAVLSYGVWVGNAEADTRLSEAAEQLLAVTGSVGGLLLVAGLCLFLARAALKKRDLDNRRYGLAQVLLQRLEMDLAPDAPVRLKLDLRPPDVLDKRVNQDMVGWWNTDFFVDPWFTLETRLADGAFVRIRMVDQLQKRERSKTSASGKTKTKTKRKGFARLEVSVRVKPERYPGLERLKVRATAATRLPRKVELERVRVAAGRLSLRARLSDEWVARPGRETGDPEAPAFWKQALEKDDASRTATMMLLSIYQVLGYTRRRAKPQAARGRRESV
ncbi:hypothetical protein HJC10_07935 [Corallococcus exiguus]|uniref:hypothetical protein n=1 Tax=Corallococcus TaxID=83461 RepID=UPI000ED6849A|nr:MULTISPECIES: hypothetical protein [Corallococcus]NNB85780.1 hypothetical protein [Corallococcus exiguus]NNB94961.1 hypothetical protein [Corallococcus exiguus]NNC02781.1 hypothetical protein [Corallococcus exiguus]NPC47921.1 hypothetical protein [Corallococcus exiguus]RKH85395.1 hypothetical protein D7X99_06735 [Corallococcus sp. AB032C]